MEDLIFDMVLDEFNEEQLIIQVTFVNPLSVSIGSKLDLFNATIVDSSIFISKDYKMRLEVDKPFEIVIPR